MANPDLLALGHISGAHGIRGQVLIKSYAKAPEDIAAYGPLRDEKGERTFTITRTRITSKGVVASLAGIEDRNAAEALKGVVLSIARENLPDPEEDEWYHADLIGLDVRDGENVSIGRVLAVQDFGAGDLVEVRLDGVRDTVLVPFTRDAIPTVAVAEGYIVVILPRGILEDALQADSEAQAASDASPSAKSAGRRAGRNQAGPRKGAAK